MEISNPLYEDHIVSVAKRWRTGYLLFLSHCALERQYRCHVRIDKLIEARRIIGVVQVYIREGWGAEHMQECLHH